MDDQIKRVSKFMSLVLRHKPEEIALQLNEQGWVAVDELVTRMNVRGFNVSVGIINIVVETNDKKRFAFNEDRSMIRANQGHSIDVELNLQETVPPDFLYHGTAIKYLDNILQDGLKKQNRQHVHLSSTIDTATSVGKRHGKPVILVIKTREMHQEGYKFYLSENKVWLTDFVPAIYITK